MPACLSSHRSLVGATARMTGVALTAVMLLCGLLPALGAHDGCHVASYTYSYPDGMPIGTVSHHRRFYDDPTMSILNDGITDTVVTDTNTVSSHDVNLGGFRPVLLDLGAETNVTLIDFSYIVKVNWTINAPSSVTFYGGATESDLSNNATLNEGFTAANGGYTVTIDTSSWPDVRFVQVDVTPTQGNSLLSEITLNVCGKQTGLMNISIPPPH